MTSRTAPFFARTAVLAWRNWVPQPVYESFDPTELTVFLNDCFESVEIRLKEDGADVVSWTADTMAACWESGRSATCAAVALREVRNGLDNPPTPTGYPRFEIGLHVGYVLQADLHGSFGETFAVAQRLQNFCRKYDADILISDAVERELEDSITRRPVDQVAVRGTSRPMLIYQLLDASYTDAAFLRAYNKGFRAFQASDWAEAGKLLLSCLDRSSNDKPARMLLERIREIETSIGAGKSYEHLFPVGGNRSTNS